MGRVVTAFRAFFGVLFGSVTVERMQSLLSGETVSTQSVPQPTPAPTSPAPKPPAKPQRNDAITLLAALQREARFVDLVQEPLGQYSNEQIGAAARDVLRDAHAVLDRLFALAPVMDGQENAPVETPAQVSSGRFRLSGNVVGDPPFKGRLVHHGWQATRVELPQWLGDQESVLVVMPAEIEC